MYIQFKPIIKFSGNCRQFIFYIQNVSAGTSLGLLHVFHAELGNPIRTFNRTVYLIHVDWSNSVNYDRMQVLL